MIDELIVQACTFADDFPPPDSGIPPCYKLYFGLDKVYMISDWKDALDAMVSLLRCVLRMTADPVAYVLGKSKVTGALDSFTKRLEELKLAGTPPSDGLGGQEELSHLRLHHRIAYMMLNTLAEDNESLHDDFIPDFLLVLEQCETIIRRRAATPEDRLSSIRGPNLGLLPPLFFVTTKCRDRAIRHRALKLMHRTLLNEREWTSCMATMVAEFVIEQEERQLTTLVPEDPASQAKARIRLLDADFSSSKHRVHLTYFHPC